MALDVNTLLAAASALLFIGLIGLFAFLIRHQEQVEPEEEVYGVELLRQHYDAGATVEQPTPYYVSAIPASPDPLEISGNLDKKILVGAATIFAVLGMIGGYFIIQGDASPLAPGKGLRGAAAEHQLRLDVRRGKEVYASLCYDCHGRDGKGGTTPEGKQLPGLPLNVAGNKYETLREDPAALGARRRLIEQTIERGRHFDPPRYSMPAWGRSEGGQLSPWQVKQLADFIMHGTEEGWADVAHIRQEHDLDHSVVERIPDPPTIRSGKDVAQASCSACHGIASGAPSVLPQAPNLTDWIASGSKPRPENPELQALARTDRDWLVKWVSNAKKIKPNTLMSPQAASEGGTLSDEAIKRVVAWLRGEEK